LNRGRVVTWLRHLYPPAWQERYGDEFDLLLEQCLHTPLDVLDVVLGALDAHLQLLSGEDLNWRILNMLNKLRNHPVDRFYCLYRLHRGRFQPGRASG
jgi:hypothetical protein